MPSGIPVPQTGFHATAYTLSAWPRYVKTCPLAIDVFTQVDFAKASRSEQAHEAIVVNVLALTFSVSRHEKPLPFNYSAGNAAVLDSHELLS